MAFKRRLKFDKRIKHKKRMDRLFILVIAVFACLGVGYSYISTSLNINGTANVTAASWDVHFDNLNVTDGSVTATTPADITDDTTIDFAATLEEPGDFYGFNIDLVNAGTIDASIGSLDITPVLTSEQQEYFEYSIKYKGGLNVQEGDALSHGNTKTIEILFRYKELDNHDLYPDEDVTFNFTITINAVQ